MGKNTRPVDENADYFLPKTNDLFLRAVGYGATSYTSKGQLGNKSALLDAHVTEGKYLVEEVHITDLSSNPPVKETDFDAPPSSTEEKIAAKPVRILSGIIASKRIGGSNPIYPDQAKHNNQSGSVVLEATIDSSGTIRDLDVIKSSYPSLDVAAYAAVRTWKYRPTLLEGKPVAITTEITVNFTMHP